jgi:hypothetical protein
VHAFLAVRSSVWSSSHRRLKEMSSCIIEWIHNVASPPDWSRVAAGAVYPDAPLGSVALTDADGARAQRAESRVLPSSTPPAAATSRPPALVVLVRHRSRLTELPESDVVRVLAEASTADVKVVLADEAVGVVAHAANRAG